MLAQSDFYILRLGQYFFFDKKEAILLLKKYHKQLQYYIRQIYIGFKDLNKEKEKEF